MDSLPERIEAAEGFPGGAPDWETHELMERLNDLQTWTVLLMTKGVPKAREAMSLVQDTRCFIVERQYPRAKEQPNEG